MPPAPFGRPPNPRGGRNRSGPPTPPISRRSWLAIPLILLLLAMLFTTFADRGTKVIPYSELKEHIRQGQVERVVISQGAVEAVPKADAAEPGVDLWRAVRVADDEELVPLIESKGIELAAREESACGSGVFWLWVLPLLFLVIFWGAMFRRMGAGPGAQALTFGKSRAKLYAEEGTGVRFSDVAGCDEVLEEMQEVVEFLREPERFYRLGGRIPKGVLLVGPPGTGKTLLGRALAGEAGVPFFNISGSDFVEMFVGVGAARVRDLFEQAQKMAPCIIFIDELDAVGKVRGAAGPITGNDEREQTLNALLVEMDGFSPKLSVIILGATNRPEILDPALLRPGRFDRQIVVDKPDIKGREAILGVHTRKVVLGNNVELGKIAAQTPGFVGADLANVVNEAALLAARRRKDKVDQAEFQDAIERVIAGLEKKNRRLNEREKRIVAYHEGGHAVVAAALPWADPVHKISIIPRGIGALGYTMQVPLEDRYLMTREELLDKIAALLGGRGAELVVFGDVTTGAQNDILKVTDIARRMITEYGMSDVVGSIHLGDGSYANFVPNPFASRRGDYSDQTAEVIDREVRTMVDQLLDKVLRILRANRGVLEDLATRLLVVEVLEGDELHGLLDRVQMIDEDRARAEALPPPGVESSAGADAVGAAEDSQSEEGGGATRSSASR